MNYSRIVVAVVGVVVGLVYKPAVAATEERP